MALKAGTPYKIVNVKHESLVLDLFESTDETIVVCRNDNGKDSQKWILSPIDNTWSIQNKFSGYFIGYLDGAQDGRALTLMDEAAPWSLHNEANGGIFKIVVPGYPMPFAIELSDPKKDGKEAKNGVLVILWLEESDRSQGWKFVEA